MQYPAMALSTPGLDRNAEMQRQPLGTFSALRRPSPVATQYKRQSEMYGMALRTLSRAARRGDAGAAMDAIKVRDQANAAGFTPGGIQRNEDVQGNIASREQDYQIGSQDLERKATLDRRSGGMSLSRDTEGTGLTPDSPKSSSNGGEWVDVGGGNGSGRGTPISRSGMSMEAQDQFAKRESSLSGAFGSGAQKVALSRKDRYDLDGELGAAKSPEEIAALKERGTKLGISSTAFDRRAKWWDSNRV